MMAGAGLVVAGGLGLIIPALVGGLSLPLVLGMLAVGGVGGIVFMAHKVLEMSMRKHPPV
ncbi:hypothetical protein [Bordetella sp. LUAb4]|uniref:hypothetical protein n=1 Tax=Bordetella sp. LUAb4 TaxID=2843195 RepID=UPI001E3476D0|nr:hypothetical protein [Bordetella sp. LUAb4]